MHIHLPKPLHGWREFLGEVGIIVVGVVIALGLEQVVETIHWHDKAEQATSALRDEVGFNFVRAAELVVASPCIDRQLTLLETRLLAGGDTKKATLFSDRSSHGFTFRAPSRPWANDIWRSVVTEGVSSHLDSEFRTGMAGYATQVDLMHNNSEQADTLGWRLRSLALADVTDPVTKARLVEEIEEERGRYDLMALVAGQMITNIQDLKLVPPEDDVRRFLTRSGTLQFCRAHNLPLADLKSKAL
jgi:hypothetical protein